MPNSYPKPFTMSYGASIRFLCRKHKYIWFKNPKAACTSFLKILYDHGHINRLPLHARQNRGISKDGQAWIPPGNRKDFFKFAFVRNPWDRMVSTFEDKTKKVTGTKYSIKSYQKWEKADFDTFVRDVYQKNICSLDAHLRPQYLNVNFGWGLDFIGKVENFSHDAKYAAEKCGIKGEVKVERINPTKRKKDYRDYYNEETKQMVEELYLIDCKLFDYKFDQEDV